MLCVYACVRAYVRACVHVTTHLRVPCYNHNFHICRIEPDFTREEATISWKLMSMVFGVLCVLTALIGIRDRLFAEVFIGNSLLHILRPGLPIEEPAITEL